MAVNILVTLTEALIQGGGWFIFFATLSGQKHLHTIGT